MKSELLFCKVSLERAEVLDLVAELRSPNCEIASLKFVARSARYKLARRCVPAAQFAPMIQLHS